MRRLSGPLVAIVLLVCAPFSVSAETIFVPGDFATLQAALDAAAGGDTVLVADGTYRGSGNKDLDFRGKSVMLRSENGPTLCIIDCEGAGRGFYFLGGGNQILDGFTILNGSTEWGGAIYCDAGSAPIIRNCRFIGNEADLGGGLCLNGSSAIISGCEFDSNVAWFHGGGIYGLNSSPTIENSVLMGNQALIGGGGGVLSFSSAPSIINCVIAGNSNESYGGGVCANHSRLLLLNCTIVENATWERGGGLDSYDSTFTVRNCIVWGNSARSGEELALSTGSTVSAQFSNVQGGAAAAYVEAGSTLTWGTGNKNTDPLFVTGPLGGYYLSQTAAGQSANSPCVDAGSDLASALGFATYTTRTNHTPDSGTVDMGHHYALLSQILLFAPANKQRLSSPPAFRWTVDGETNNGYAVEMRYPYSSSWFSTHINMRLQINGTSWAMPDSIWKRIPAGSTVKWRVRGADLERSPRTIIISDQTFTFYKK